MLISFNRNFFIYTLREWFKKYSSSKILIELIDRYKKYSLSHSVDGINTELRTIYRNVLTYCLCFSYKIVSEISSDIKFYIL